MSAFNTSGITNEYYKVSWLQMVDLVRNRKVFISDGFAYVVQTDVISGICQTFRSELSQELIVSIFQTFLYFKFV